MTMGTRIAVMRQGTLQQVTAPREIYAKSTDMYVAGLAGSPKISFNPATASGTVVRAGSFAVPIVRTSPVSQVTVGIRPERLSPDGGNGSDRNGQTINLNIKPTNVLFFDRRRARPEVTGSGLSVAPVGEPGIDLVRVPEDGAITLRRSAAVARPGNGPKWDSDKACLSRVDIHGPR